MHSELLLSERIVPRRAIVVLPELLVTGPLVDHGRCVHIEHVHACTTRLRLTALVYVFTWGMCACAAMLFIQFAAILSRELVV